MTRKVTTRQAALTRARERRRELDRQRDEADQRIEEAAAVVLVALEDREETEQALEAATGKVAEALRLLMAEDVSAERAAALLELDVAEVRRLAKVAAPGVVERPKSAERPAGRATALTALPDVVGGEGASRRAG